MVKLIYEVLVKKTFRTEIKLIELKTHSSEYSQRLQLRQWKYIPLIIAAIT